MKLKVKLISQNARMPIFSTEGAACFDLYTTSTQQNTVTSMTPVVLGTGLAFEMPTDHVMLVFSRSGHGFKNDVRLANCVGVIDSDFRGELKVKLSSDGMPYTVAPGERIAQAMIIKKPSVVFEQVEELSDTNRGKAGFGSTGKG